MHPGAGPEHEAVVRRHVAAVAAGLSQQMGEVVPGMRAVLSERIQELGAEPTLLDLMTSSIEGNVDTILHSLQHGISSARIEPPTAAFEYARRLAQRGVPVTALVRAYRLGQQFLLRPVFQLSLSLPEEAAGVGAEAYELIVHEVSDYIDWISQRIVEVYEEERETWLADPAHALAAQVRQVVDGADLDTGAAERLIGYRLQGRHVAVIAWRVDQSVDAAEDPGAAQAVRALAQEIGDGSAPLVVGWDHATTWAWIPVDDDYRCGAAVGLGERMRGTGQAFALGSSRQGLAGFRRSHREARRVHQVAVLRGSTSPAVLSHDQPGMAVSALLAQDLDATRDWVHDTLGDLAGDDETAERSRQTLATFLLHDGSFTATAEAMQMHRNSIKYRVTSAEKLLGRSISDDRLDLAVALSVCAWLGPAVLV